MQAENAVSRSAKLRCCFEKTGYCRIDSLGLSQNPWLEECISDISFFFFFGGGGKTYITQNLSF